MNQARTMKTTDEVIAVPNRRGGKTKYHRTDCTVALKAERGEWGGLVRRRTLGSFSGFHRISEPAGCCKPTDASAAQYTESLRG